ncbi:MAG: FAD-dependent oxidoreductase [Flavobacteriales bacterium]|nr:FAD-dependent oxidoreductase [Flavobacteriales bacterium]MCB9190174.1 FAD-dependent oxidoreductase [Flavobacteriales bacterium]MCB9205402.1 FAD-dependent oxidoreductase [Flavobacteriales bacterium]
MKQTENLIVGLGIAGLNLCHQLEKAGKSFLVIDRCPENSSSLIAGGIYNPVALKRKLRSWRVDELFPTLITAYSEIDALLGVSTLQHPFPILKPIVSDDDLNEWKTAVKDERLVPYVNAVEESVPKGPFKQDVKAYVTIENAGFVRISKLIASYQNYLNQKGLLLQDEFYHHNINILDDGIEYQGIQADRIIFAEGRFASQNPYFSWLPMRATKGQMLTVRLPESVTPDRIYNQQFLLFPLEEKGLFRLGATYEWGQLDETPTEEATQELLTKVKKTLDVEIEVLDAQAAVRPTVIDRRPIIGQHPDHRPIWIFNGLGTKGIMLAPYFAKQLVEHIYEGAAIDPEVSLKRFGKHYANS